MAEWVSHLIVADRVLERLPELRRHEFCVGSIAPDCNLPGADGKGLIPSREVMHWMQDRRKKAADCERFKQKYILDRFDQIRSAEELSFLLGYYSHLVTDAEMQRTIRDEQRVAAAWKRAKSIPELCEKAKGMTEDWDSFKMLFPDRSERLKDFHVIEREYLDEHPDSGWFTEIAGLSSFPDYLDYLPGNAIPVKVKMMYYDPSPETGKYPFIAFSRDEYSSFLDRSTAYVTAGIACLACRIDR